MNHLISKNILFAFTKNGPYDIIKEVKPDAHLGNRIREQFCIWIDRMFEVFQRSASNA